MQMDDIESFEFDLEEAKELIYTGKLSMQDFANLIRRDVSRIEKTIETIKAMLVSLKKHEPGKKKKQAQLQTLLDEYTVWLAKYDGLVVEYERADEV